MFRHVVAASALLLASGLSADDGPQRPKIYGIAFVRLKSSDFSKASETYSKILGLPAGTSKGKNGCTNVNNPCIVVNGSHITSATMASASPKSRPLLRAARSSRQDPEGNRIGFVERSAHGSFSPAPRQVSSYLVHAGFVAKDLHVMNKSYLDTLGFRLYWKGGFEDLPPGTPRKDSDIDWFEIQVPDGSDWVEYMLNIPANADHQELGVQNHFCLGVRNMQEAIEELHKNGLAPTANSPTTSPKSAATASGNTTSTIPTSPVSS